MKKFDFYLKLRALGIDEALAVSMTTQSSKRGREEAQVEDNAADAILAFADWEQTTEGYTYWHTRYNEAGG